MVHRAGEALMSFVMIMFNSVVALLRKLCTWLLPPPPPTSESENENDLYCMEANNSPSLLMVSFSSNLIFAPLIPVLLNFLQIRSSATNPSPFKLHPLIFSASVICSVIYYFVVAMKFMFHGSASQLEVLMSAFGSLALAPLICLILQLPWWSIFIILFLLGGLLMLLNKIYNGNGDERRGSQPRARQLPLLPLHN